MKLRWARHFTRKVIRLPFGRAARLFRFFIVGGVATVVYYSLILVMVELIRVPILFATSIAFLLVTLENYALHYTWTFASNDNPHLIAFPRFLLMNFVGFLINFFIMALGVHMARANYLIVQGVAITAIVIWNLALSSLWGFKKN